jgi:hypothetical protein
VPLVPNDNARAHLAKRAIGPADVVLEVLDIGSPPAGLEADPAWRKTSEVRIPHGDVRETFEGQTENLAAQAMRALVVRERALLVYVTFGARPDVDALARVNEVLATLRVDPR